MKKKVTFIKTYTVQAVDGPTYEEGKSYDMDEASAQHHISRGRAVDEEAAKALRKQQKEVAKELAVNAALEDIYVAEEGVSAAQANLEAAESKEDKAAAKAALKEAESALKEAEATLEELGA